MDCLWRCGKQRGWAIQGGFRKMKSAVGKEARSFTPFTPISSNLGLCLFSQWFAVVRMHSHGRIYSLFSNVMQLPKLNVASSILVSRSIFSITWEDLKNKRYSVYSVFFPKPAERSLSRLLNLP
jgi:hypothetical protein